MEAQQNNQSFKLENLFNVKNKVQNKTKHDLIRITKVALITGGGSGIGLMATQALAVNGAKVYITGRTQEKLDRVVELYSKNITGSIIPLTADITRKDEIDNLSKEISSREGHLSILINNAGIANESQETEHEDAGRLRESLFEDSNATFAQWDDVFRTNVSQLFFMTSAFLPLLQKGSEMDHGWSSTVINTTSISGLVKVSQHHFAYNASKAAAIHLTKMLAHEVQSSNLKIRVNHIAPGVFPSEMTAGASDEKQKNFIPAEKYQEKVPAARPGKDEDMASAMLFAVTNQYLNGQSVVVDGGYVLRAGSL
ncbi:uncharacterized protein N7511_006357 [Penicillium nucicola]|uniref:uncharacterized protein n=1 Tax=Penicillium nucicola TaxID=1850975 RepID=UPI0025451C5D|nr:uncharacterized protein N7511_006357 [Penicillium nucicola]KAJ5757663.1 hypothetical protein N7511_006357 [Penicillium nucicola]